VGTLQNIRRKIRAGMYEMTDHARIEMLEDGFQVPDVENGILTGRIVRTFTEDRRGDRYAIEGQAKDRRAITIICRVRELGMLRIVTLWAGGYDENY
jgi:uncharacterized DUF497 family protein